MSLEAALVLGYFVGFIGLPWAVSSLHDWHKDKVSSAWNRGYMKGYKHGTD